ncbi:unnamed protein product [Rotaria magnacalcarata]|uniref:Uncharacterized protein n=3 Tax=Rotaria magnacalcarata TaxID=392030 RepID=A0A816YPN4_9BILA|nr:unnamed protein product [Rotaria magnacalcarata]CAF1653911.1 unnamed protein product [Rotaria magnacalcarata]CAF2131945.1 unnamed protein product [Rotaria magnacalcarata]CAF2163772.1 unnamed protein product [Rotaria magnacalcarata]CAF2165569.1 unnamed protein product [Rotaria magnacalcarata]
MTLEDEILQELQHLSVEKHKDETKTTFHPKYDPMYYSNLIWNSSSYEDVAQIQVALIPVENDDQRDLFDFIRHTISSMPQCQIPGRVLSVLVHDQRLNRFLGIIQLTTDLLKSEFKDEFIGFDEKKRGPLKKHIRDHSANLSICVPVQPFGFDFCGGKLLAMLSFSTELHDLYQRRYSKSLALITTTSIHGKSIQYDRLKQLKFIGYTKGYGTSHISSSLMTKVNTFLDLNYPKFNAKKQSKWQALRFLTTQLNIDSHQVFNHGNQRGIYCGWTGTNAKEFLLRQRADFKKDKLQPVDEIATFWKVRWAKQRSAHLNRDRT